MKQYNSKHTAVLSTRGFYTILTVCCLIIAVSAWVLWTSADDPAQTETGLRPMCPSSPRRRTCPI